MYHGFLRLSHWFCTCLITFCLDGDIVWQEKNLSDLCVVVECVAAVSGFDRNGYDREGYDRWQLDKSGFARGGFNLTGYNQQGEYDGIIDYDKSGYDAEGFNRFVKYHEVFVKL